MNSLQEPVLLEIFRSLCYCKIVSFFNPIHELGRDARGNTIRIENAIRSMPDRRKEIQVAYDNLQTQMEQAQEELGKPFPQEEEYQAKTARLVELNAVLNMENKRDSDIEEEKEECPVHHRDRGEEIL